MSCNGMRSQSDDGACEQIKHRSPPTKVQDSQIIRNLTRPIVNFPLSKLLGVDKQWTQSVMKGKQPNPKELRQNLSKVRSLKVRWNINIEPRDTLKRMMIEMILSKLNTLGNTHGQVGENGKPLVVLKVFKRE